MPGGTEKRRSASSSSLALREPPMNLMNHVLKHVGMKKHSVVILLGRVFLHAAVDEVLNPACSPYRRHTRNGSQAAERVCR